MAAQELFTTSLFNDANLQAYYRAENVNDATANARNLTNTNSVTFSAAKFNNGFDFGSSNTNKRLNTTSKLGIDGGAISVSLWVKFTAEITSSLWSLAAHSSNVTQTRTDIYYQFNGGGAGIGLLVGRTRIGVANDRTTYTNLSLADGAFHNLIYSYDGTNYVVYVDGVNKNGGASTGNGNTNGTDGFAIGNDTTAALITDNGIFDDVAIFNRGLTGADASLIFNGQSGGTLTLNSKKW